MTILKENFKFQSGDVLVFKGDRRFSYVYLNDHKTLALVEGDAVSAKIIEYEGNSWGIDTFKNYDIYRNGSQITIKESVN